MKKELSRKEAEEKIKGFFQKDKFTAEQARKIKSLAMKYRIRLGDHKKRFCKKCFWSLIEGKVRINKGVKNVECIKCSFVNRWKIKNANI